MPIVQTSSGPKPTLTLAGGTPTTLAVPSQPLGAFRGGIERTGKLGPMSFAHVYRTQPWVASAANVLVRQTARLPLKVFRYLDDSGEARDRVRDHAVASLLAAPSPRRRGLHWRAQMAMSVFVQGTSVSWKRRRSPGAPPHELIHLDWRHLAPRGYGGIVEVWEWSGQGIDGIPRFIDPDDVVVVGWGSLESEVGVSPLEQLGVTIRSEDGLQRYSDATMRNGTRFGVAAILDKSVNADKVVRDGVREELNAVHGGIENTGKPAILGGGIIDLKPIGEQSAVEAELISQRKVNREEIAAVYGVPQPLAGILDHGTYSNVKELHSMLYVTFLGAHLSLISETIQAQLIENEPAWAADDVYVEFDLGEVLKGDIVERMQAYAVAIQNGILTLNDVRRMENSRPYTDPAADEPLLGVNNIRPLSSVTGAQDDSDPAKKVGKPILDVIADAVERSMDRTARGVGAGKDAVASLDPDRMKTELAADLRERAGMNGGSVDIAAGIAGGIAADLVGVTTVDEVRGLTALYRRTHR